VTTRYLAIFLAVHLPVEVREDEPKQNRWIEALFRH
jgi:hypothetical protein